MARHRVGVATMFFVNGMLFATWVSRLPAVKDTLRLSEAGLGVALFGMAVGTLAALPLTGSFVARWGSGRVTVVSALGCCLALPLAGKAPTHATLTVALTLFGAALGVMDVAMNVQAVRVEHVVGRSIMASFHGLWSVGGLVGAGVGGGFAAQDVKPFAHFLLIGTVLAFIALAAIGSVVPQGAEERQRRVSLAWPPRSAVVVGVVAACGAVIEGGIADWSGVYLRGTLRTGSGFAAGGYAAFSLAMAIGRFTGDRLIDRLGPVALLARGAFVAAVAIAAALLSGEPTVVVACLAVAGLGMSTVFPIAFSAAGSTKGSHPGTAIAAVATMGYAGGLIGPPFIGFAARATSLRLALGGLVGLCLAIGLLAGNLEGASGANGR